MLIKFLGAEGEVTGSSYMLTSGNGQTILIDFGMFQGSEELEKENYVLPDINIKDLSAVLLTHAHLDHCGRLPLLTKNGFRQNIWMTPPTADLTELSLFDSAHLSEDRPAPTGPLFTKDDVIKTLQHFRTTEYDRGFTIGSFDVTFRDAGHILGSSSIEIIDNSSRKKIVFSGDLGNTPEDLIKKTENIKWADFAVIESTYGDKLHEKEDVQQILQSEINEVEKTKGALLIPAFSIERSQEVLHRISHLKETGRIKAETVIYFDSPMAEKATDIFEKYKSYYNDEFRGDFARSNPFHFEGLIYVGSRQESQKARQSVEAKVIIAGSGMMTGGRILDHAITYLPRPTTRVLIVGYQAQGTLGRQIQSGAKKVVIEGIPVNVNAAVNSVESLSSHADQPRLLNWLKSIEKLRTVFLTHGEDPQRSALSAKIKTDLGIGNVTLPVLNEEIDLN